MNFPGIILDGISMSLLFNAVVGLGFLLVCPFTGLIVAGIGQML